MPRIIEALATALLSEDPINFSELDIKYGFWRMMYAVGEEWNFAYVLPTSGSTNQVSNTGRSANGIDIVSLLLPCGIINIT